MASYTDEELIQMFRNSATRNYAFNLLVTRYREKVYYFVRRIVINHDDADDVVQNIFIKVWKNLDEFREDSRFFTWLYRITVNEALSFMKSLKLHTFLSLTSPEASLLKAIHDDNFFEGNEVECKLREAVIKLPEKQRIVFNLRYYDEMPYEQMSEVLGTSVGALKASYHFAMKKVEETLLGN
ncbi:MAG TPA: RNA polymerase sigma factor [Bacteroidales bacterium]|nr:RNA polymerase sigma factor [Bacteroidales bacterium]